MSNESGRRSRLGLIVSVVGAGLIIIALAVVASRGGHETATPAPQADMAAPPAAPKAAFAWHDPRPEPATVFKDAEGNDKTLADFSGKVLVVNFWATWCAPCVKEMPTLDALQGQMGGPGFQVLTISQDREGAQVAQPFVEKNGWKNLALYTEAAGHFQKDAGLNGLPTSVIIDKSGQEVGRVEGEVNWTSPEVEQKLKELEGQ